MVLEPASIRSLLIRAWRERWSDIQWGIHIKTVLPRYISGDIYQLSDCLLQQALMGSLPNNLILSYLHHSLASQIVSFGGVIESISKYDSLNKPYCIQALLNLMLSMMKNVSCKGKAEDCLMLSSSLVAGVKWLIQVMSAAIEKLIELQTAPEHSTNMNLARSVLQEILQSPFLTCLFHIGCNEDTAIWSECVKKICQLETEIGAAASGVIENKDGLVATIREIKEMKPLSLIQGKTKYDSTKMPFCYSIFTLILLEVMKHTTRGAKIITQQLLLLQKFKGLTVAELYFEIIRTCFMGLSAPEFKKYQELKWVGFTYIKLPIIIHAIHTSLYGESNSGFSKELLVAVQKIASMTSLLDVADYRVKCNCLEYLFKELIPKVPQPNQANQPPSLDLLSERDAQTILANRMQESNVLRTLKNNESQGSPLSSPDLILRAQPTVIGILKTLTNKNMDSIMTVLSLLISGKSRELLLIVATSSGSLHIYAQKFVKLNEQSKEPTAGETAKMAASRALVFDISFLLLCHIAQVYGIKVVVSENCDTFVERWIQDNIPELGKIKTVISPSEAVDMSAIEEFLRQINCLDSESRYVKSNFAEVCKMAAFCMRELINAAHHGQVLKQMIFDLLDKFCHHLCSLPICVTAWLCSYMQQVDGEEAFLAQEFLHYMQTKMVSHDNVNSSLETFKDRSNLMSEIISHVSDIMSRPTVSNLTSNKNSLNTPVPLTDILEVVWTEIKNANGILTQRALHLSRDLLRLGGVKWFVTNFAKSALDNVFENELMRSVDVVFGLFHLDIVNCTLNYLVFTLPNYICGPSSADLMCEPRTSALGRLTAMLLVECWVAIQPQKSPQPSEGSSTTSVMPVSSPPSHRRGQKRSFTQREMEDFQDRFLAFEPLFSIDSLAASSDVTFFLSAVHHMFTLMTQVSRTAVVSPVTHLIVFTLKELVSLPHSSTLLSLLPPSLLSNLLPLLPSSLTFDYPQLLALSATDPHQEGVTLLPLDLLAQSHRKEKEMIRVVNEVYHHYNKHQFPMVVLNIKMNEDDDDVNVTPDKRQIMVNREKLLLATIKTTLICLYENIPSTLDIQNSSLHCFNSSRNLSTPTSKASPSTPKFSALSERFSRTPTTPLSDDAKFRGMKTGQSSFGGIKRALSSHSDFQAAMKQPKLQAFSFKINGTVQSTKEGKVLSRCTTEEGQDDNLDDSFMEGLEKIDGERLESFSSHLDDIKTCGDELITQSSNQKEKLALPNSNKSSVKFPPKEIHSKTEAFLSSLKARKCPSNLSQRNSSIETSSKNSVQEVVLVEECDKIETKEDDSNDDHERTPPTMIVFDDVNDEDVVMMNPSQTRTKSFTVPFSVEALRRKFSSRRKSAKNGTKNVYRKFRAKIAPTDNHSAEEELKKEISKESFGQMELVGQFNLGFIVTRLHSDLFIVDQHATDEKYNFETLQKSCVLQNQKLILPQTMELTAANEGILMDNMDIFTKNGFEFKVDDTKEVGRRVLLTSMPHSKGWDFKKEDVEEMIFMLSDTPGVMCRPSRVNAMFASRACRKSVMIGTPSNFTQMRKLVDHMGELEQPWNCPHGRPTIRHVINLDLLTKLD